jgi:hypothetical protein
VVEWYNNNIRYYYTQDVSDELRSMLINLKKN